MSSSRATRDTVLAVPVDATDHSRGHPHAAVVIVEYGDFECPNCKQAAPVLELLLQRYPLHLRLVYRHFPLEEVHPHALAAAMAAESAGAQGRFWPMHELLFRNQAHLKPAHLRRYAEGLELDMRLFDAEMADTVRLQRVREHVAGAVRSGVRATPTFFVNSTLQDVSFGLDALEERIRREVASCEPAY
jgi:protein-disulfide isomerase